MAFNQIQSDEDVMLDINMTPLIDVLLVLIIMIIITIPIQKHAISMDNPRASQTSVQKPTEVQLKIDSSGKIVWDGVIVSSDADLKQKLLQLAANSQAVLKVAPSSNAPYQYVAKVLAAAQRNGVKQLSVEGNQQYINRLM